MILHLPSTFFSVCFGHRVVYATHIDVPSPRKLGGKGEQEMRAAIYNYFIPYLKVGEPRCEIVAEEAVSC